jgi:hypothetical protein
MMVLAVVAGYGPFQTWRYAAADYAYLDALSAAGKTLPRESYSPARVSDAVNFAKTPLLEAIGYRARLNTNRWARFLAFEALAHAEDPSRLAGTPRAFLPGPASAAVPDRSAWAAERLRTLAPLEADFDELRLAAARPFAQVDPASFTAFELDPNRPYSPGYRLLARLLVVHATAQLELGRSDAALRDLRVVQCLADALSGNRRFESMMLRVAVVQSCQEGFGKACASGRWTDAELRQWEAWFATVDLLQDLDLTLRGAEADALNNTFDSPSAALQGFPLYWWWFRDQRLYNELLFGYCDTAFDTRRQQVYPGRSQAFQEQAARRLKDSALGLSAHPLASVHFPDLDQALPKVARIQTLVNLSRVAGALTRYRTNMRRLPSTLNELAPRYLPRVPHDLVGGKPLVYRQTADDQFVLYSIGWNERDDGGVVAPASLGGQDGDWVWK